MAILTKASVVSFGANFMAKPGLLGKFQCVDFMATGIRLPRLSVNEVHNRNNTTIITTSKSGKLGHRDHEAERAPHRG